MTGRQVLLTVQSVTDLYWQQSSSAFTPTICDDRWANFLVKIVLRARHPAALHLVRDTIKVATKSAWPESAGSAARGQYQLDLDRPGGSIAERRKTTREVVGVAHRP
jgi:hypothetical protein